MAPKVPKRSYWIAFAVLVLVALGLAGGTPQSMILQIQNAGSAIATIVNYGVLNCSTGMTCTASGSGVDSGSGTAYVVTGGPITSLTPIGTTECFLPLNANSSSTPTVAFNGLTGKTIVKLTGAVLAISDMVTTQTACVVYNGTNFYLLNPQGATGSGKAVLQTSPSFTAGFTTLNILTSGNCAGVGTAAQPSVASCAGRRGWAILVFHVRYVLLPGKHHGSDGKQRHYCAANGEHGRGYCPERYMQHHGKHALAHDHILIHWDQFHDSVDATGYKPGLLLLHDHQLMNWPFVTRAHFREVERQRDDLKTELAAGKPAAEGSPTSLPPVIYGNNEIACGKS